MDDRIDIWRPASVSIDLYVVAGAAAYTKECIADHVGRDQAGSDRWHMTLGAIWRSHAKYWSGKSKFNDRCRTLPSKSAFA
jgi:hypothetical protein